MGRVEVGRVREASSAPGEREAGERNGLACAVAKEEEEVDGLVRLDAGEVVSPAARFLEMRFAAARTDLDCFSSWKIAWMLVMEMRERASGLFFFQRHGSDLRA